MANQLQITGDTKVKSLSGVLTGTSGLVGSVPLGAANGVATLDSGGKVPVSQLPSSVVTYLGTWNAATNTPTLVNGVGDAGDMYICNVAGTVNFGAGPVTFAVGDWVLYGSGTWQKSNGQNGTVTSVGASITGNAIGLTGSPITTAGTLAFAFSGTSGQYVNGAGNLTTFPTLITSIGLSMPSAFSVANSPLTANGSINVTGAGTTAQYIDGTGALQTFPALTGYVPYTGATTDVDLGTHVLNAQALHVKGTAGAGHLGLKHQTASPTGSANESLIFADVNGNLGWQNGNLYLTTLVSNANTANRSYTFPNASGTLALTSDISYPVTSVFGRTGAVVATSGDYTTTLVTEGTRLYYTDTRARAALSFTAGSGAYNSTTGVITIPTNTSQLTNGANFITLASLSAGAGISYNNTTGVITSTITQYTDAMARAAISGGTGISYNSTTGVITNTITQYTDALARAAISLTTTGTSGAATYNSTTGVLNIPQYTDAYTGTVTSVGLSAPTGFSVSGSPVTSSGTLALAFAVGYSLPTTASQTNWDTAYTNRITSATSPLSITSNVISISQATTSTSGYLSSTDWNTFNSKQGTITLTTTGTSGASTLVSNTLNIPNYTLSGLGGIGGSGTANYLPKFTAGTTIGNSVIQEASNNIGIGHSPSYKFDINNVGGASATARLYGNDQANVRLRLENTGGRIWELTGGLTGANNSTFTIYDATAAATRLQIDASGNLGLGVTPSAWSNSGNLQLDTYLNLSSQGAYGGTINNNAYYNAGWKYIGANYATQYQTIAGEHRWLTAGVGSGAGAAISFTQAMTLFSTGNLGIGTTTDSGYKLDVNGTGRFSGALTGTSATFSGGINQGGGTLNYNQTLYTAGVNPSYLQIANGSTGTASANGLLVGLDGTGNAYINQQSAFNLYLRTNGINALTIASTGAATFSSSVTAGGDVLVPYDGTDRFIGARYSATYYNGFVLNGGTRSTGVVSRSGDATDYIWFGTNTATERMRITNGGVVSCLSRVLVNGATDDGSNALQVSGSIVATSTIAAVVPSNVDMFVFNNTGATYTKSCVVASMTATGGTGSYFFYGQQSTSTVALKIFSNGNIQNTNNSYGAISDARLKENIIDATPKLADLMKVKVRNYNLKGEKTKQLGVISQELEEIFPNMIEESTNLGENVKIKGVKYSVFVPMLIKAVQELKAEIETLKNK